MRFRLAQQLRGSARTLVRRPSWHAVGRVSHIRPSEPRCSCCTGGSKTKEQDAAAAACGPGVVMAMAAADLFNVDRQYRFYGRYHSNHVNRQIHLFSVPIIHVSSLVLLTGLHGTVGPYRIDLASVATLAYAAYYLALDTKIASVMVPYCLVMRALASAVLAGGLDHTRTAAAVAKAVGWMSQLVGHFFFERNSPAFTQSIVQAFLSAPMFVVLEIVWDCGGLTSVRRQLSEARSSE